MGKKQVILGGAEIVALAIIALGALHVLISKGMESIEEIITIEVDGDKSTTVIQRKIKWGITARLAEMLKSITPSKILGNSGKASGSPVSSPKPSNSDEASNQ